MREFRPWISRNVEDREDRDGGEIAAALPQILTSTGDI